MNGYLLAAKYKNIQYYQYGTYITMQSYPSLRHTPTPL
jgi:hypothetical protein